MDAKGGVQNPNIIDLVTHDPITDEYALIMIEMRRWGESPEQLLQLQEKINNYLTFAQEGQMRKTYPESIGKPMRLQLDCYYLPNEEAARFIEIAKNRLAQTGTKFVLNLLRGSESSRIS